MAAAEHTSEGNELSAERKAYEQKIEAQLDELSARIELLGAKANQATADAKIAIIERLGELRDQQADAQRRLQEVREAGEEAWTDLRAGLDQAMESLRTGIEQAISRFE